MKERENEYKEGYPRGGGRKPMYTCESVLIFPRVPKHLKGEILAYIEKISQGFKTKK